MSGSSVLIVGDLMLDHYLVGSCDRISPEAPVPVVSVREENRLLGGAGNVARNISALGGKPVLVAAVGNDDDGRRLDSLCQDAGIHSRLITDESRPTTIKTRIIASNQQVVRVDRECIDCLANIAYDRMFTIIEEELPRHAIIILSDYGKGVISATFMERFWSLVNDLDERPMILVDPKTRNYHLYEGVDLLTPNTKEASEMSLLSVGNKGEIITAGTTLMDRLKSRHLLITLGAQGMALFDRKDNVYHIPTVAQKVFDVTGAGDTVIATLALALSSGCDLLTASVLANYAAGIVVGQIGAATTTIAELESAYGDQPDPGITKWMG